MMNTDTKILNNIFQTESILTIKRIIHHKRKKKSEVAQLCPTLWDPVALCPGRAPTLTGKSKQLPSESADSAGKTVFPGMD